MTSDVTDQTSPALTALRAKIQALIDLNNRLQNLRQIPAVILRPPTTSSTLPDVPQQTLHHEYQELKEITDAVRSEKIQSALIAARDSEQKDKTELEFKGRRDTRKRRRLPSPESPQPYRETHTKSTSLFPPPDAAPLQLDGLIPFLREYNRSNICRLHIWSPTRKEQLSFPIVLRFTIPDVVTIFLTIGHRPDKSTLVVENATAFGPREQKPPHSQSDFVVYRKLTQQISKIIQSQPLVPFQSVVDLLSSYSDLFVQRCSVCQRILSLEGHVPPVARVWLSGAEAKTEQAGWRPRHVACLQLTQAS